MFRLQVPPGFWAYEAFGARAPDSVGKGKIMTTRDGHAPILGNHGLAFLRLTVSSYFIAISFDLIPGVNPGPVFQTWFDDAQAHFIGDSLMVGCSLFVFLGLYLRYSCLYLAVLVLCATIMENVLLVGVRAPDALWRDIVLVSALLLVYGSLSRQGLRQVALVRPPRTVRKITVKAPRVMPRRVIATRRAPEIGMTASGAAGLARLHALRGRLQQRGGEDITNIFVDNDRPPVGALA